MDSNLSSLINLMNEADGFFDGLAQFEGSEELRTLTEQEGALLEQASNPDIANQPLD